MTDPEYMYGGQWFDDMGALAYSFPDSPRVGIDIARTGVSRAQANDIALKLMRSGLAPYEEAAPAPPETEFMNAEFDQPA